jgi:hypothetical protein
LQRLAGWRDRGREGARAAVTPVGHEVQALRAVDGLLRPREAAPGEEREAPCVARWLAWEASGDPRPPPCAKGMRSGEPGGGAGADFPAATWDVARWCKRPTGPERRLQGRHPAGVRLGPQGPALLLALDAPGHHHGPLTGDDLEPSRPRRVPASQQEAVERGKIRRQARSRKKRSVWLADLAKRSWNAP